MDSCHSDWSTHEANYLEGMLQLWDLVESNRWIILLNKLFELYIHNASKFEYSLSQMDCLKHWIHNEVG